MRFEEESMVLGVVVHAVRGSVGGFEGLLLFHSNHDLSVLIANTLLFVSWNIFICAWTSMVT